MTDRWWETETNWFSWNVPELSLGGWTYCQARPNADLCNGGAWVWDDGAAYPWELVYRAEYSGLQLPPRSERDIRDLEWPNGVHVRVVEPLRRYDVSYSDPGALELDLEFEAIMAPNPHPTGVIPFLRGVHFDQAGHVTGRMVLHGEDNSHRLLLGARPLVGAAAARSTEASYGRRRIAGGEFRRRGLFLLCGRPGRGLAGVRRPRSRS